MAGKVLMLELGVAVTEFTRTKVLVIVVVDWEVVSSAAATWAAAMQRKEVIREPNCILAIVKDAMRFCVCGTECNGRESLEEDEGNSRSLGKKARHYRGLVKQFRKRFCFEYVLNLEGKRVGLKKTKE